MNPKNPKVAFFFDKAEQWKAEYGRLREIALDCPLTEEVKWGVPCYTVEGKNVMLIHGFKEYCAVLFPKGVLMQDPQNILIIQTENVQSARQLRFKSLEQIEGMANLIKEYILEAIQVELSGRKVEFKKTTEFNMPEEFQVRLDQDPKLQESFEKLTPGRQRAYLLFFSAPKQAKTREARVEKMMGKILAGKGMDD